MINNVKSKLKEFHNNEEGDIVQTSIIIGIFAVIAIGALVFLGPKVKAMFTKAGTSLDSGAKYSY